MSENQSKLITVEINDTELVNQIDFIANNVGATRQEVISGIFTFGISSLLDLIEKGNSITKNKLSNLRLVKKKQTQGVWDNE